MMREEDIETAIKVVIVGNGAVGKSSMIQRYCKGSFMRDYKKTIGVDFLERLIDVNGEDVRLMLWDTAGQEEFDAITKAYYRGAQACVLAFSTTDIDSFCAIPNWKRKVEDEVGEITMVLVQNKIDLLDMSSIDEAEVADMAAKLSLPLFRTSVKDDIRVDDVFLYLANRYLTQLDCVEDEPPVRAPAIGDPNLLNSSPAHNGKQQQPVHKKKHRKWLGRSPSEENTIHLEPSKRRGSHKMSVSKCRIL